jgi:hypothetical protein
MSTAPPAEPSKSIAVTVIGLLTLLLGGAYATLGGCFVFVGLAGVARLEDDPAGGFGPILQILAGFVAVVGVALLLQGVPGMLAGLGVLFRKQWGRRLTLILAVLAFLWGLASLGVSQTAPYIAFGVTQILYSGLAFVILIRNSAEFSRPGG